MFLKLHKFKVCENDYELARSGNTFCIRSETINKIETEEKWKKGKLLGTYTALYDFSGNRYYVSESADEVYGMIKEEEKCAT